MTGCFTLMYGYLSMPVFLFIFYYFFGTVCFFSESVQYKFELQKNKAMGLPILHPLRNHSFVTPSVRVPAELPEHVETRNQRWMARVPTNKHIDICKKLLEFDIERI